MQGWSTTIRTGNPEIDLRTVDQHRAQAQQQGLVLHVQPLPQGGYHVQAVAPAGAPQPQYGAPDPAEAYGGTMPSANRPPTPAPMPAMPMPAPFFQSRDGSSPAPPAADPLAQFGGTMPSPAGFAAQVRPAPQVIMHPSAQFGGMGSCQACGREGPTKNLTFMQNIGVIVIRFPKTITGNLCKFCIDKYFFKMTLITFFFGWWGVISFVYTLISLPVNVVNRLRAIGMESPREDAGSVAEKRSRGLALLLVGILFGLLSLLQLLAMIAVIADGTDVLDMLPALVVGLLVLDVPAFLLLFSGIRDRVRASRAARQLGIA